MPATPAAPIDRTVFFVSSAVLAVVVFVAALAPDAANTLFSTVQNGIVANFSWYYVLVVALILISLTFFAVSSYGDIKLGPDHAEPDYSFTSWFAMLFAAGMGIGLMFFGVAEPVMHFLNPPVGDGATVGAAREAMKLTFFHWGVHAWGVYAIVAIVLAYFSFRHNLPLTLRSALYPIFGDRIYGPLGTIVDVFAILSTTFGVATSLGFGVEQINSGLNYLFGVPKAAWVQVALIVVTTGLATISVVLGLDVGIKRLSELNIALAVLLLLLVLALGPTVSLMQAFMQNTGGYISELVSKTFNLYAYKPNEWLGGWTIFYWGWWISWAPFVGMFIARISRGRTLREFAVGVLLGPTLFTFLWMTVFGNSAIDLVLNQGMAELGEAVQADESVALFKFFEHLPLTGAISFIAVLMVMVFFITSADSGAMVLNMLSSNGREDTPVLRRVYWMAMIGASAMVLMLAGGLSALQTAAIASALPFSLVMLVAAWGFASALRVDHAKRVAQMSLPGVTANSEPWRSRLQKLLKYPGTEDVRQYIAQTVRPQLTEVMDEFRTSGLTAQIIEDPERPSVRLEVLHGEEIDFTYEVRSREHVMPGDALAGEDSATYHRAEVHLNEGGQDYDVMGWTRQQIADDVLTQYEKHLHFLHVLR